MMMGGAPPPAAKPKTIQPPESLPPDLKKYAMMLKIGQSEDQVKGKMKMDKKDGNDNFYLVKAFHTKKPVEVPAPEGVFVVSTLIHFCSSFQDLLRSLQRQTCHLRFPCLVE